MRRRMTPAQQRGATRWSTYQRPTIHRPSRTLMIIASFDQKLGTVTAIDWAGTVRSICVI